ncbi:hypothetical protein [Tessaracoccus sp. OH4464_COT-324]|uniref:hypothetical protein n=1 Tax=Tessaracoccus sp. OH4464_COT-324 TaxID=2491059 RepID=UPI000F635C9D|nr:hypothetical protein [Tessaracoccus sp. OH4464_COT-324]RRD47421.1 hypothetical protein EII42_02180 [Tessaracoccus sp. OH4464_COT-324]
MSRLLIICCAALLALCGCNSPAAEPVTVELTVPTGGLPETIVQEVPVGAEVTFKVTTATDDVVHIHGYEIEFPTKADEPVTKIFTANMAGAYEVESHVTNQIYMKLKIK